LGKYAISDFDGTLTDTDAEAQPYVDEFPRAFSERFHIPHAALVGMIARHSAAVSEDPASGWINDGKVVAPAIADPYVFTTTVFGRLYESMFGPAGRAETLREFHERAYRLSRTVFRPGAGEFLRELLKRREVVIVTNSSTSAVEMKLDLLREAHGLPAIPVIGNAKKYVIDDAWTDLPTSITPPGFPRPVLLRRKRYADALASLGWPAHETAVIGDVYELDLALPEQLGYQTVQLRTPGTPSWELGYEARGRSLVRTYRQALACLR